MEDHATTDEPRSGRWLELLSPAYLFTTLTLCLGVALMAFNVFLASTSMPSAIADLDGAALIAWSVSLYLIFAIVGGAAAAMLKARFGGRAVLCASALVFIAGSALAGAAPAMLVLLLGRVLQGLGEGIIAAICYALIPELIPSRLMPKIFGAEAAVWAAAAFGGPVLAGWLTETFSWRAAFLFNVPVALVFLGLAFAVVSPGRPQAAAGAGFPVARLSLIAGAMLLVTFAGADIGLGAALAMVAAAVAVLVYATMSDRAAPSRLFPADAFRFSTPIGLGLWVALLMPVAQSAPAVYLVYGLQHLWGFQPTLAGTIGAVMAISWSLTQIAIANLEIGRWHLRAIWVGPILLVFGLAAELAAFYSGLLAVMVTGQVLVGSAFGLTWGHLSQALMQVARDEERNRTSALLPTMQSAGYGIGAAIMGIIANAAGFGTARAAADIRHALIVVFAVAAALAVPACIAAVRAVLLLSRR